MNLILLWFASLLSFSVDLFGEDKIPPFFLNFEPAEISISSHMWAEYRLVWGFRHVETEGNEEISADYTFSSVAFSQFPLPLTFTLKKFEWSSPSQGELGLSPLLIKEGKCLQDLNLNGMLISTPPFIDFSPVVRNKYRFSLLSTPPFGEELFTLIEIGKRALLPGLEFKITPNTRDGVLPFEKQVKVLSVSDHGALFEVKTVFKRIKLILGEEEGKAVICGSSTALWNVNLEQSLNFSIEEEGMMNDNIRVGESTANRIYQFKKNLKAKVKN